MSDTKFLSQADIANVNLKLLVIEDSEDDIFLLKTLLSKSRFLTFDLLWAKRIREALPMIAAGGVDVILTDLTLPDTRGVETVAKLNAAAAKVPIVVMTGTDDERLALEILRAGAQDYLIKNKISTSELTRAIRYSIERKALLVELSDALENVKTLSGLLPICASCKNIRNDQGYWKTVESYIQEHTNAQFTHGLCPGCAKKFFEGAH